MQTAGQAWDRAFARLCPFSGVENAELEHSVSETVCASIHMYKHRRSMCLVGPAG